MKWLAVPAALLLALPMVCAERVVEGEIVTVYPDRADTGLFAFVESVAPGTIPNGFFYYVIEDVTPGAAYTLEALDAETYGPVTIPQFCIYDCALTPGEYGNGPGDDAGVVPGHGDAVVILVLGKPFSRFRYTEA